MGNTIIKCKRCGASCKVDALRDSKAKMLRHSKEPKGVCVNCAVHDWMRNTYPVNLILAQSRSGPKSLLIPQIQELLTIGELVERARNAGVQTIVEGPGHIPLDEIEANVKIAKAICKGAPFYVLGPLVTDIAPGYDHIVGAIGGAIAAMAGADYLCYVTPTEHIGLPDVEDVREGVIVSRIAAHAADLVRRKEVAVKWDNEMSKARSEFDWEKQISLAPDRLQSNLPRGPAFLFLKSLNARIRSTSASISACRSASVMAQPHTKAFPCCLASMKLAVYRPT